MTGPETDAAPAETAETARPERQQLAAAWSVHLFTATGAVVGTMALLAIFAGDYHRAALLMLVALAIDSVDGTLARRARVSEVIPGFDGRRLDDMVDFFNYVLVPMVFVVTAGLVGSWVWIVPPILASAYGFSQSNAKTEDDFFLGFPSYWNVVALYLWIFEVAAWTGAAVLLALAIAVFVPLKYVYPSKAPRLRRTTNTLGTIWVIVFAVAVAFREATASFHLAELLDLGPNWSVWLGRSLRDGF
ncbi:MAG: CDP-alcohol phosphatidyltransferase family protein [Deltaproteobacteria bacterium]|nr:CDP-alcohol phosphatidyltransferase family protein [Deltaproteobacteria bacterium]